MCLFRIGLAFWVSLFRPPFLPHSHFSGKTKQISMATTAVVGRIVDQSVRSLGPDGGLRRRRFSQADAKQLIARGQVIGKWNRTRTRVQTIQFFDREGADPAKPQRWHKTGTRYSYAEAVGDHSCWCHKALPFRAMDAQLGNVEPREVIDAHVRELFCGVLVSLLQTQKRANVVSIEVGRQDLRQKQVKRAPATVIPFERAA